MTEHFKSVFLTITIQPHLKYGIGNSLETFVVIPQKMFRHPLQQAMTPTPGVRLQLGTISTLHLSLHNIT